jgi:DHA3 family tetracycline resistance protein-like MFS transporter
LSDPVTTKERRSARTIYLVIRCIDGFTWMMWGTIFSVYMIVDARLNPLELVMLGTFLEATVLLMEVPTGAFADAVGRKLSVIVGFAVIGIALLTVGLVRSFPMLAIAQILWGLGFTFWSGAEVAWITDEVG